MPHRKRPTPYARGIRRALRSRSGRREESGASPPPTTWRSRRSILRARSVVLTGRTADFAKAFQVQLACYEHAGGTYRGRTGSISVPTELSKIVVSVHGLDDRPQAQPHFRAKPPNANPSAASGTYTPYQIARPTTSLRRPNGQGRDHRHHRARRRLYAVGPEHVLQRAGYFAGADVS